MTVLDAGKRVHLRLQERAKRTNLCSVEILELVEHGEVAGAGEQTDQPPKSYDLGKQSGTPNVSKAWRWLTALRLYRNRESARRKPGILPLRPEWLGIACWISVVLPILADPPALVILAKYQRSRSMIRVTARSSSVYP